MYYYVIYENICGSHIILLKIAFSLSRAKISSTIFIWKWQYSLIQKFYSMIRFSHKTWFYQIHFNLTANDCESHIWLCNIPVWSSFFFFSLIFVERFMFNIELTTCSRYYYFFLFFFAWIRQLCNFTSKNIFLFGMRFTEKG